VKYFEPIVAVLILGTLAWAVWFVRRHSAAEREREDDLRRFRNHLRTQAERQDAEGQR
jgi:hypothetical protein